MSPEIRQNKVPFYGYVIETWAVGVILFIMCTGYDPWEVPCDWGKEFYYFTRDHWAEII